MLIFVLILSPEGQIGLALWDNDCWASLSREESLIKFLYFIRNLGNQEYEELMCIMLEDRLKLLMHKFLQEYWYNMWIVMEVRIMVGVFLRCFSWQG